MYSPSRNETQIQHKLHFHKTEQDIYDIHKNFKEVEINELSVEDIINTVFSYCEHKKQAQISAQIYICHRIIAKAAELELTPIFYRDPYEYSNTLYEEPTYILVKDRIFDIAKNILSRPATLLLKRCSKPSRRRQIKKKAPKQKKRKTGKSIALNESLKSIVGKFPSLIIPKLSPKEIEYHMKAKYRIFDLEKSKRINKRKDKSPRKTKHVKKNKENIPDTGVRRSSRLRAKLMTLNVEKNFQDNFSVVNETNYLQDDDFSVVSETNYQKDDDFSVVSETNYQKDDNSSVIAENYLQVDHQYAKTYFQDNNALGETKSLKNVMTIKTHDYQMDNELAEKHLQVDDIYPVGETNFHEHIDLQVDKQYLPVCETNFQEHDLQVDKQYLPVCDSYDSYDDVDNETDDVIDNVQMSVHDEQNVQENNNLCEFSSNEYSEENTECVDSQIESVSSEQEKYEKVSKHLRGGYTFELVVKTKINVASDPCEHLKDEFGLDKDVVESLRQLYKSVHDGRNNYIFCELGY